MSNKTIVFKINKMSGEEKCASLDTKYFSCFPERKTRLRIFMEKEIELCQQEVKNTTRTRSSYYSHKSESCRFTSARKWPPVYRHDATKLVRFASEPVAKFSISGLAQAGDVCKYSPETHSGCLVLGALCGASCPHKRRSASCFARVTRLV